MGKIRFNYRSQAIKRYVDVTVVYPTDNCTYYEIEKGDIPDVLPTEKEKFLYKQGMKFQTVYLVHGGGDDDSLPYRYTNAERYAQDNNVMLVTPDISNSFGVDTNYGVDYSTFLNKELPVVIQSLFASSSKREDNFIAGFAMGGNVALGSAIMYPERYNVCVDMSGGIGLTLNTDTFKEELEGDHFKSHFSLYNHTFGEGKDFVESRHDLYAIAKKYLDEGKQMPKFYIIAGTEEFVYDRIKADADKMKEMGFDITYIEAEGYDHNFDMWDKYIKLMLDEILPLKRKPIY